MFPQKIPSMLLMYPLLILWISKNIMQEYKGPAWEFNCVKNKQLLSNFESTKVYLDVKSLRTLKAITEFYWFLKKKILVTPPLIHIILSSWNYIHCYAHLCGMLP